MSREDSTPVRARTLSRCPPADPATAPRYRLHACGPAKCHGDGDGEGAHLRVRSPILEQAHRTDRRWVAHGGSSQPSMTSPLVLLSHLPFPVTLPAAQLIGRLPCPIRRARSRPPVHPPSILNLLSLRPQAHPRLREVSHSLAQERCTSWGLCTRMHHLTLAWPVIRGHGTHERWKH